VAGRIITFLQQPVKVVREHISEELEPVQPIDGMRPLFAPWRLESRRFAYLRSGVISEKSVRHSFHSVAPFRRISTCSLLAIIGKDHVFDRIRAHNAKRRWVKW